jgi:hypothetical protein
MIVQETNCPKNRGKAKFPEDPAHRLSYFWRRNAFNVQSIVQWGNADAEPGYREYLRLWLEALHKPDDEWRDIVRRKGWALEDIDPDWDKIRAPGE